MKNILLSIIFLLNIVCVFADDSSYYATPDEVQQQSEVSQDVVVEQQKISQAYDDKEAYYNYCSLYSMYDYGDPMYGYGFPVWGYGYDNCDYVNDTIISSDSSADTTSVTYPNLHKNDNGEVVFDQ